MLSPRKAFLFLISPFLTIILLIDFAQLQAEFVQLLLVNT